MLLQKVRIGKTAVLIIVLIILGLLAALPLFLRADGAGEADHLQYLPLILNEADNAPNPGTEATPISTASPTSTASSTATGTSTNTPLPQCDIAFNSQVYAGDNAVGITGDVGTEVTIINLSDDNTVLGSGILSGPVAGHACEGFASISLSPPLNITNTGDILLAVDPENPDNSDTIIVFGTPTVTPSSTPTPIETPTPKPADLVIGQPILISTPPVVAYQPLAFEVPITNTGEVDINTLFFVDLLFDPTPAHQVDSYTAVSALAGGNTITLTITSTIGLANFIGNHQVTALVDSLDHVIEADETNNLSAPFEITISESAMTPDYTPTPTGGSTISGVARAMLGGTFLPQERMHLSAIEVTTGEIVAVTYSDENGFFQFDNLIVGTAYTVQGCIMIDNNAYLGVRTNRTPPDASADIFAVQSASCP